MSSFTFQGLQFTVKRAYVSDQDSLQKGSLMYGVAVSAGLPNQQPFVTLTDISIRLSRENQVYLMAPTKDIPNTTRKTALFFLFPGEENREIQAQFTVKLLVAAKQFYSMAQERAESFAQPREIIWKDLPSEVRELAMMAPAGKPKSIQKNGESQEHIPF